MAAVDTIDIQNQIYVAVKKAFQAKSLEARPCHIFQGIHASSHYLKNLDVGIKAQWCFQVRHILGYVKAQWCFQVRYILTP